MVEDQIGPNFKFLRKKVGYILANVTNIHIWQTLGNLLKLKLKILSLPSLAWLGDKFKMQARLGPASKASQIS